MACTLSERANRRALRARKSLKAIFPLLFSALRLVEVNLELCLDDDHHDDVGGG